MTLDELYEIFIEDKKLILYRQLLKLLKIDMLLFHDILEKVIYQI